MKLREPFPLKMLNKLLDLPSLTSIAKLITERCPVCGQEYIERALARFSESKKYRCWFCNPFSIILANLTRLIGSFLGFDRNDLKEFLSEPWMKRILLNQIHGLAIFGRSRPQSVVAPVIAVWEITNECNLNCSYCHVNAKTRLADELNGEEKIKLIDEIANMGTVALMIAGGEPLCSPELFNVVKYAHDRGLYTVIITNGLLLSEENARKLIDAGLDYIKVSIDSASPEVHDSLRGNGSWERAIQGIKNSVKAGLMTGIAFTLTRASVKELPDVIDLAKSLGVKRIILFNFVPSGRGRYVAHLDLGGIERESVLEQAFNETYNLLIDSNGIEISTTAPQGPRIAMSKILSRIPSKNWLKAVKKLTAYGRIQALAGILSEGCSAGITVISIRSNGDVKPCDLMPITIGNIKKKSFKDVWLRNDCLRRLRNRKNVKGWCASCPFLVNCGGCRSRAYAYFGDLFESDPNCLYEKKVKVCIA